MSDFKKNNFFHNIFSKSESQKNKLNKDSPIEKINISQKIWKKNYNPFRHILLWGWDDHDNPSFVILYGNHEFESSEYDGNAFRAILKEEVKYTNYAIFRGKEGHLPSFEAVKIYNSTYYSSENAEDYPKMYYKKGVKRRWYYRKDDKYLVKEFKKLEPNNQVSFPYFVHQTYEQYIQKLKKHNIEFTGFKLAENPNEILMLQNELTQYYELMINILSHHNLYMRKKKLKELLSINVPNEVYKILFKVGSAEVISGLFLELAKMKNPVLIEDAKMLIKSKVNWAHENYAKGVERCANIYINALNKDLKADRINWIHENISNMDFHLIRIQGKEISSDTVLNGAKYRKYANTGLLRDYYWRYDREQRKSFRCKKPQRYKKGPYTDGTEIKLINFKNTIQEAEAYGLADVIGKIAYYLDAPRLTYYFKGSNRCKQLNYFHRYIRRIIDSYGKNDPEKFIIAMKALFSSYTKDDYVCKFYGNFQFNKYIKHYLYYDFKEKPPAADWNNWQVRYKWMRNDQLMKLEGRHEYMKEIWDNHLDVVVDIALKSEVDQVIKACYYILKESPNSNIFIKNMTYKHIINLSLVSYKPLAEMFKNVLKNKMEQLKTFDIELMIALIGCSDKKMHTIAMEFFERTDGMFSPSDVADLLLLENLEEWIELFKKNIFAFEESQYAQFISYILNNVSRYLETEDICEDIKEILTMSTNKIKNISKSEKINLMIDLINVLYTEQKMPNWIATYIEEIIFSFSYEELESLLIDVDTNTIKKSVSVRNKRIISILDSVKTACIPSDAQIISILESGTSKMIKMLFEIIMTNNKQLDNRLSTLLIMLESEVTLLNNLAQDTFETMPKENQKKLHGLIIDSPVNKAYSFGLEKLDMFYGDSIPEEFIIQMLEHGSKDVKAFISDKMNKVLDNLGNENEELFMYYVKTLLLLPNKISKSKDRIYKVIPKFVFKYKHREDEVESLLLDIGGSNIIKDSERALIALAKIRGEVNQLES